jgi:hypothetical protein
MDTRLQNVDADYVLDGGSMALHLTDIHGNTSTISIDNQSFVVLLPEEERKSIETIAKINKLKIKCIAIYDSKTKDSEKIEYHSDLETSVLKRVERMAKKNPRFREELLYFIETTGKERTLSVIYE